VIGDGDVIVFGIGFIHLVYLMVLVSVSWLMDDVIVAQTHTYPLRVEFQLHQ
jgi:hypothetical protein